MLKELPDIPLNDFLDLLLDAVCMVDTENRFVFVSAACENIFGYTQAEMIGKKVEDLVHPEDRLITLERASQVMSGKIMPAHENRYIRKDGTIVHLMWTARWSDELQVRIGVARDISQRKQAEFVKSAVYEISEAAHTAHDLSALYKEMHQIINTLMPTNNFYVALYNIQENNLSYAYYVDELHTQAPSGCLEEDPICAEVIRYGKSILLQPGDNSELKLKASLQSSKRPVYWLGVPLKSDYEVIGAIVVQSYSENPSYTDKDRELLQFVSIQIAAAITRRNMLTQLEFNAQFDPLTHLPNRALLNDRLHSALTRAKREQTMLALLFIDLNEFKRVNDDFGHVAGDHLLRDVAERLTLCVRESDTVARLGGDEFIILLERISNQENALRISEKVQAAFLEPFSLDGRNLEISLSIGMAFYPQDGKDATTLLQYADKAMYAAKSSDKKVSLS